jgi:hypothetical protein
MKITNREIFTGAAIGGSIVVFIYGLQLVLHLILYV